MDRWSRNASLAIALSISLAASADAVSTPPEPGLMIIARIEGQAVGVAPGGDREVPLVVNEKLSEGSIVQTLADSRMEIVFASGTIVRLGEKTRLELRESPPAGGHFRARLVLGNFWAHVHKLLSGETFVLETENAVAGVRGTEFRVEVSAGNPDLLRVYEGVVQVDGKAAAGSGILSYSHRIEPGRELRFAGGAGGAPHGPQEFFRESEADNAFVKWVDAQKASDPPFHDEKTREDKSERKDNLRERLRHFFRKD